MLKKIIVAGLLITIVIAIGVSAYNAFAHQIALDKPTSVGTGASQMRGNQGSGRYNQAPTVADPSSVVEKLNSQTAPAVAPSGDLQILPDALSASSTSQGNPGGYGQSRGRRGNLTGSSTGEAIPQPQNGLTTWITLQGSVSSYYAPNFTLLTTEAQNIPVQLGNLTYLETLGLNLKDGDQVIITGNYDASGAFAVAQLTLVATGETFVLRDSYGRPMWSGGRQNR